MYWLYNSCQHVKKKKKNVISPENCAFKLELFIGQSGICFRRTTVELYQPDTENCNCLELETRSKLLDYNDY